MVMMIEKIRTGMMVNFDII